MDNFGWSIALVPGTPLIIGDTPDAHIQLQGAYGTKAIDHPKLSIFIIS